jgi:elongation factor P
MLKAVDLRKGKTILYAGEPAVVHEAQHVAKGNKRSYMQTKIKNLKTGVIQEVRFRVDDMVEVPYVETKEYEYLYREGDNFIFMDTESFDQIPIASDFVGDDVQWLVSNTKVTGQIFNGQLMGIEMPHVVVLEITDTPPVVKGATATNQPKDAILETGARVRVPPFCDNGMKIRVDTRTGEYIERA